MNVVTAKDPAGKDIDSDLMVGVYRITLRRNAVRDERLIEVWLEDCRLMQIIGKHELKQLIEVLEITKERIG